MLLKSLAHALLVMTLFTTGAAMAATSLGGKLELDDEGSFFVNGRNLKISNPGSSVVTGVSPPGNIKVNQMYVHYRIPAAAKNIPVVMVHGSGHTGMTYETTPDGRVTLEYAECLGAKDLIGVEVPRRERRQRARTRDAMPETHLAPG